MSTVLDSVDSEALSASSQKENSELFRLLLRGSVSNGEI